MKLKDSLDYTSNELAFGTSGLRGLLSDMTDLECYINTTGFLRFLESSGEDVQTVYLAGDLRHSTPHIMQVIAQAITDAGIEYVNCGFIPTPAVAYYAQLRNEPCIVVTGSHIPDDRNGIKFYKSAGEVLKEDESAIKKSVAETRAEIYAEEAGRFLKNGSIADLTEIRDIDDSAREAFIKRHTDYFLTDALSGLKIIMYQHSAVGRDLIPEILRLLGAEVIEEARSEKFIPIDTENVRPVDEVLFKELAENNPSCFAIVSTDGDSDRPFVIDETGTFHRGDILGLVVSEYLGSKAVAFPVSTNDAVTEFLDKKGVKFSYTKIGSPYVISAMNELKDDYVNVSGWEVNGGFMVGEDYEQDGRELKALPTRDACLPIICALLDAKAKNFKLSELFATLPKRYTQAGLINDFPNEVSRKMVTTLAKDDGAAREIIEATFTDKEGFSGEIQHINSLDGIRITFGNGDVAHMRPSGNAPQLRIYSNADSQKRADEIVKLAIEEPHGIFRKLEELID